jgi:hypothetical protein
MTAVERSPDRRVQGQPPTNEWSGSRPLVSGAPVAIGIGVLVIAVTALLLSLGRAPGLPAKLAQEYTSMMAGSLAPVVRGGDAATLGRDIAAAGSAVTPRIVSLEPDFTLLGGRPHTVAGRRAAAWFYRSPAVDSALGLAFEGRLTDLGPPDDVRHQERTTLHVFRKTTQTIVCWQEGPLVYALISTIPSEVVIALARRHAAPRDE